MAVSSGCPYGVRIKENGKLPSKEWIGPLPGAPEAEPSRSLVVGKQRRAVFA